MSEAERATVTVDSGIAEVRLNRPSKHNGLDPAMFDAVVAAGESLREDNTVRVVILSGEGPSFCAGLDLSELASGGLLDFYCRRRGSSGCRFGRGFSGGVFLATPAKQAFALFTGLGFVVVFGTKHG